MTAVALPDASHPLLALLSSVDQLDEWAGRLGAHRRGGLVIAHTRDRRTEAEYLAGGLAVDTVLLNRIDRLEYSVSRGDLMLVLASPTARVHSASCPAAGALAALHGLIHAGVEIWGLTGRRPNSVADHCHDSIAVPDDDPGIVLKSHQLIAQLLVRRARLAQRSAT